MTINKQQTKRLLELLTEAADARKVDYGPGDALAEELLEMHRQLLKGYSIKGNGVRARKLIAK